MYSRIKEQSLTLSDRIPEFSEISLLLTMTDHLILGDSHVG